LDRSTAPSESSPAHCPCSTASPTRSPLPRASGSTSHLHICSKPAGVFPGRFCFGRC
jgi:hypothetical protein